MILAKELLPESEEQHPTRTPTDSRWGRPRCAARQHPALKGHCPQASTYGHTAQMLSRARPLSSLPCPLTIKKLWWLLSQPLERHPGGAAPKEEPKGREPPGMEITSDKVTVTVKAFGHNCTYGGLAVGVDRLV